MNMFNVNKKFELFHQFNQVTPEGWWIWFYRKLQSWIWGPAVSLHNCMAAFFSADELKGDNMYR